MKGLGHYVPPTLRHIAADPFAGLPPGSRRFGEWAPKPAKNEARLPPLDLWQLRGNLALEWLRWLMLFAAAAAIVAMIIFIWRVTVG